MAVIEQGKCKIARINADGLGVCVTSMGVLTLPYTIEGELVEFERHSYRGSSNAILKDILKPASVRRKPECQYFGSCGGCLLQHLEDSYYNAFKIDILAEALAAKSLDTIIHPMISIPSGSRRRATFEAIKKDNKVFLGFHRFQSHQIINIDKCPILTPKLSALIKPLKEVLSKVLEKKEKVTISITEAENGVDILINIERPLGAYQKQHLSVFARKYAIRLQTLFADRFDIIFKQENPFVVFDGVKVEIDEGCFLQSSAMSDEIIAKLVLGALEPGAVVKKVADLFCGRGTITLPLSRYFDVDGFESDEVAVSALNEASSKVSRPIKAQTRNLYDHPLKTSELENYEYVVLNPPRHGAKKQCEELKLSGVTKIVYVSCNIDSFTRDAKILCAGGYKLLEVTPVDQFYYSSHLEVVGVLALIDNACSPAASSSESKS